MCENIDIDAKEVEKIFLLLEKLNTFMHQPMHYENHSDVESFIHNVYPDIKEAYYDIVWNWLSNDVKKKLEDR